MCKWLHYELMRPNSALDPSPVVLKRVQACAPSWPIKIVDYNLTVNLRCFDCLVVECHFSSGVYSHAYQCIEQLQPDTVHMLLECILYLT